MCVSRFWLVTVAACASMVCPAAVSAQQPYRVVVIADTDLSDLNRTVEHMRSPSINGNGTVAFEADIKVPAGPEIAEGIWIGNGNGTATLVMDPRLGVHSDIRLLFEGLWIDNRDRVAFRAGTYTNCGSQAGSGVFLVDPASNLTWISDSCWSNPAAQQPQWLGVPGLAMNDAGQVVLSGRHDINNSLKEGLFRWNEATG